MQRHLPVLHDDMLVGIIGLAQVRGVAQRNWPSTRTEDVMVAKPDMPSGKRYETSVPQSHFFVSFFYCSLRYYTGLLIFQTLISLLQTSTILAIIGT
jgi:hypothetical protein